MLSLINKCRNEIQKVVENDELNEQKHFLPEQKIK